jgi:hypothetical protein
MSPGSLGRREAGGARGEEEKGMEEEAGIRTASVF